MKVLVRERKMRLLSDIHKSNEPVVGDGRKKFHRTLDLARLSTLTRLDLSAQVRRGVLAPFGSHCDKELPWQERLSPQGTVPLPLPTTSSPFEAIINLQLTLNDLPICYNHYGIIKLLPLIGWS